MNVQADSKLNELNELKAFIENLAVQNYERTKKGLLLSRVGEILSKDRPDLRITALGTKKLADFIEQELEESVKLLVSAENKIIRVILPASVRIDGDVMEYFPERNTISSSIGVPRYNRAFWAAFSHPLKEGYIRLVGFDPQVHYVDVPEGDSTEANKMKVPNDSIIDTMREPVPDKRVHLINEKISEWLQDKQVSLDLVDAKTEARRASAKLLESGKGSLLEILLTSLDDADLRRIQIPLDIVAKLNRRL